MSDVWKRKIGIHFRRIDLDKDGVVSKSDYELFAIRFAANENLDPVQERKLRTLFVNVWLIYMDSTEADENGLLTEAVMIDSLRKHKNDPKVKERFRKLCRSVLETLHTNEDVYIDLTEFRRAAKSFGLSYEDIADCAFEAVDVNHAGKLSLDEVALAYEKYLFTEDAESPCSPFYGTLN